MVEDRSQRIAVNSDFSEIQVEPSAIGEQQLHVEGISHAVWEKGEPLKLLAEPNICASLFREHDSRSQAMLSTVNTAADHQDSNTHGWGGKKIRVNRVWQQETFRLLTVRALLMFCKVFGTSTAHLTDRWANAMHSTDYSAPHCHYESQGSAVYFADMGEASPDHPLSGAFELMDPRIPACCVREPQRPTRGIIPAVRAGIMLMFPSELLHHVHPYYGQRPRITFAWNINPGKQPTDMNYSMEDQLAGTKGLVTNPAEGT